LSADQLPVLIENLDVYDIRHAFDTQLVTRESVDQIDGGVDGVGLLVGDATNRVGACHETLRPEPTLSQTSDAHVSSRTYAPQCGKSAICRSPSEGSKSRPLVWSTRE